ncbi:CPBP family intramembrane glutamic endopeptidase [Chryseobacterium rhizosphaerae]|uniref:CPBP family intramembrane glutamic endopeptidase n=1 Tax=Chryseobacterium rhizosphaerae TaxID=395937 RepID=UPI002358EF16|nr:CPBP family intramembrane glutamic endopeptidase [Chryseobacterium rhizosphaerae]MDC8102027.1 CPBP family intramembrane metalloprotease [Chryseobacterium rhizosphaerae]
MSKTICFFSIFILGFIIYYFFDVFYFKNIQQFSKEIFYSKAIAHMMAYTITLIPLVITLKVLFPTKSILSLLSLDKSITKGFILAFLGTSPMLIGYGLYFKINTALNIESLFINTISSAFFEEIIFRAFLIGTLYRFTRLGFLSSLLFGSLVFAQVHLYQSQNSMELIEIFTITFLGSVFFAWIYIEQGFNLWSAIFPHFFMNLYWEIFTVSENVAGSLYGNLYKLLSIFLIIAFIVYHKRKNKIPFQITWRMLFSKSTEVQS